MKILVVENESHLRAGIIQILADCCPDVVQVFEADSVSTGLSSIKNVDPDLIFLDVELDDGTGFDLLAQLEDFEFQLVFITAHDKYALQAFKVCALDYLLKPVDPLEIAACVKKAKNRITNNSLKQQLNFLAEHLNHQHKGTSPKIVLKDSTTTYFVKISDIFYCEASGTYTQFFVHPDQIITVSKNLKAFESILEPQGFIRTHHAYLVNAQKVKMFDRKAGGSALILENDYSVPVSFRKKDFVLQMLESISF